MGAGGCPDVGGVYLLLIEVTSPVRLRVGRLGDLTFGGGIYAYVGSARRGLRPRIERHLRGGKRLFWHIDYLLSSASVSIGEVWVSTEMGECELAGSLAGSGLFRFYGGGFGSSDCRCPSHLLRLTGNIDNVLGWFPRIGLRPWKAIL